jgi:hypothetical protein
MNTNVVERRRRIMQAISEEAAKRPTGEGLVFSYGEVERGVLAALSAADEWQPYWERPFGDAGDAIDFACGHCAPDEVVAFLEDWRSAPHGNLAEAWPGYMEWLKAQHEGAKAAASQEQGS